MRTGRVCVLSSRTADRCRRRVKWSVGAAVVNAEVWTTALRECRNALYWDKAKSFAISLSEAADPLIFAP